MHRTEYARTYVEKPKVNSNVHLCSSLFHAREFQKMNTTPTRSMSTKSLEKQLAKKHRPYKKMHPHF